MRRRSFVLAGAALALTSPIGRAQIRAPLLIAGKRSLFQRVIIKPGAILYSGPGNGKTRPIPGFSVYFVYTKSSDGNWIEIGRAADGTVDGWVATPKAIEWAHTMIASFATYGEREPVLFLQTKDDARRLMLDPNPGQRAAAMRAAAKAGNPGAVVAIEPEKYVDIGKNFYLLPIRSATLMDREIGGSVRLLEVVSAPAEPPPADPPVAANPLKDYKAAVVFLIDTTLSMQPYIDATREAVRSIVQQIGTSPAAENFRFGLIAYRDSLQDNKDLEYEARLFAAPDFSASLQDFETRIANVVQSPVASTGFDEDPIGGLKFAYDRIEWEKFGARIVVLITDAGARKSTHPYSMTHLDIPQIRSLLQERHIATFAIHLLTPAGKLRHDHEPARAQYEALTRYGSGEPLYYPVADGSPAAFGSTVTKLSAALIRHAAAAAGQTIGKVGEPADAHMEQQVAIVSEAMRLAWLGRVDNARAPDVVEAFTYDRDPANPRIASLDVRVLLTRNQLSDLRDSLDQIVKAGVAGHIDPDKFFVSLRAAFLAAARDPSRLTHLDRIGNVLGEFLDGLPYQSQIMDITEADWMAMGAIAQRSVLNDVESKLKLYQEYAAQTDLWVDLSGTRSPGEAMYPVPIDALP
jgi:serine/threonine-protein kinase PpkA